VKVNQVYGLMNTLNSYPLILAENEEMLEQRAGIFFNGIPNKATVYPTWRSQFRVVKVTFDNEDE
jgi:hypothetical protein